MQKIVVLQDAKGQYVQLWGKRYPVNAGDKTIYVAGTTYELLGVNDLTSVDQISKVVKAMKPKKVKKQK